MDPYIRVLLLEQEQETISVLTLSLSEIPECNLEVNSSLERALQRDRQEPPDLVLYACEPLDPHDLQAIRSIQAAFNGVYVIVSLPARDEDLINRVMIAGASDCIVKDKNYVSNLMSSVKRAFIRIAEREAFQIGPLDRADQFAMDENLPDVVFSLDLEGKVLYVNRAVSALLGYQQKEMLDRQFAEFFSSPEGRKEFLEFLSQVEYRINFRKTVSLRNSLGIEEDFEVNLTLLEGTSIYGVARKLELTGNVQSAASIEEKKERAAENAGFTDDVVPARLGPYRLVTLLGAGSMGRVYHAVDEQLERDVAVKVIRRTRAEDQDTAALFHKEAKILASICHPNIALIYYYGKLEGLSYFCMEFLPGGSLEDLLQEKRHLDAETAISFAMQVTLGLKEAWSKGVMHLDIKPSNLMLAEDARVKVVDFGLAKRSREIELEGKGLVGTPLYIAPEQIVGGTIDFRCDVYSLGITLFQMLFGFTPFAGTTTREVFSRKLQEELPAYENLTPVIPKPLYQLIRRMIERNPHQRVESYDELIDELEKVRKALHDPVAVPELVSPAESSILLQGNLRQRPFSEVLAEIGIRGLTGKLTLSWIDIYKTIHFRNGHMIAVLSSQEGENFIDLVLAYSPGMRKKIPSSSSDLFQGYSTAIEHLSAQVREKLFSDLENLAWRILEGLYSWIFGEFLFEAGDYPAQMSMNLEYQRVLDRGARDWLDLTTIRNRLLDGQCRIYHTPQYQQILRNLNLQPSDRFLLFRFENSILFRELFSLSGISEEEFFRLVYLFVCLGLLRIEALDKTVPRPPQVSPQITAAIPAGQNRKPADGQSQIKPATAKSAVTDPGLHHFQSAIKSYQEKNYWAATEYCKKALEHRTDANILRLMGKALATYPKFRLEALEALRKAQELEPKNAGLEVDMGDIHFLNGNYSLAWFRYEAALKLEPSNAQAASRMEALRKKIGVSL